MGTAMLVAAVVGSGIMADRLTGDAALALLANTVATGPILAVLITLLAPLSGAHFNPAVTLAFALRGEIAPAEAFLYGLAQVAGGVAGCVAAHLMFELPAFQVSTMTRSGAGQWLAEFVAAFGLMATILASIRFRPTSVGWLVGLYITAAYWFTASTSFANPAVAVARSMTDTFSGIRPADLPPFLIAEFTGAIAAVALMGWLLRPGPDNR
jgi:glycerol uptake facilitator-like aquaporin